MLPHCVLAFLLPEESFYCAKQRVGLTSQRPCDGGNIKL